jgi:hypothetical protein
VPVPAGPNGRARSIHLIVQDGALTGDRPHSTHHQGRPVPNCRRRAAGGRDSVPGRSADRTVEGKEIRGVDEHGVRMVEQVQAGGRPSNWPQVSTVRPRATQWNPGSPATVRWACWRRLGQRVLRRHRQATTVGLDALSTREREVAAMVAGGPNQQGRRGRALPQREDDREPPRPDLHQARRPFPRRIDGRHRPGGSLTSAGSPFHRPDGEHLLSCCRRELGSREWRRVRRVSACRSPGRRGRPRRPAGRAPARRSRGGW